MSAFSRPPGVYDRLPAETAAVAVIQADLSRILSSFGYRPVETPLIEYADLFLTKSGDDAINRLFNFELYGRQLCLRPEFTASAARLYVERFQHEPKPIRWQLGGPIFRYESPQHSHSRQFTMLSVELIGPSGTAGDAETLGLAARGLLALGLRDWTLHVGHVGLAALMLQRFALDRRTQRFLLGQIENLRRSDRGRAYVAEQYEEMCGIPPGAPGVTEATQSISATTNDVARTLELLIESANLGALGSGRTHEDVARRLLARQQRAAQRGEVSAALDFLEHFAAIAAPPNIAFRELAKLLPDDAEIQGTVGDFRAALDLLQAYDVPSAQVQVELGLARGLNYYTGIVFEIYSYNSYSPAANAASREIGQQPGLQSEAQSQASQLCGGGRYDDLLRVLGAAQDTPAVGFAYGLERILDEAERIGRRFAEPTPRALVVPIGEADNHYAAQLANRLRSAWPNGAVELYTLSNPAAHTLSQALAYADKRSIPYVFIVGEDERQAQSATVRDMRSGQQITAPLIDLPGALHRLGSDTNL